MNKIAMTLILSALIAGASFAQVKFGVTAGVNFSNTVWEDGRMNSKGSNNLRTGFQGGAVVDFSLNEKFSISPELLFTQRGSKGVLSEMKLNYLQLPLNVVYKWSIGNRSKLLVFAGSYLGYGLSGELKKPVFNADDSSWGSIYEDVSFGSKADELKTLDFGVNAGIGYQFRKMFLKFQFSPGLTNLSNIEAVISKNTNLAITTGYFF